MDKMKILVLSLAVAALAGLAVLAAFSFTRHTSGTIASLSPQQSVQAVRSLPPAPVRVTAPNATAPAREAQLANLDYELNELPREEELSQDLAAQAQGIQQLRVRVAELQNALSRNYGKLMAEAVSSSIGNDSQQNLDFDLAITELQQKLSNAKIAVSAQQRVLDNFITSVTEITRPYHDEMARRKRVVTELEQSIADLYLEKQERTAQKNARQAARLRAWRAERTALEGDYADALEALARAERNYETMLRNAADFRARARALEAEKKRLER